MLNPFKTGKDPSWPEMRAPEGGQRLGIEPAALRLTNGKWQGKSSKPPHEECSTEIIATIAGGGQRLGLQDTHRHWKLGRHYNLGMPAKAQVHQQRRYSPCTPYSGVGGQTINPLGVIRLPLWFGDKAKPRNLEFEFFVVDVPTVDNVILRRLTIHRVKAMIALYMLQILV
ncbi:hypothetical protein Cgig2_021905 [Carnegiea gigantea]|uniref:Uncharacterized protein n=1 Tax=Carnegiea gigantea TaxID=171969 RepID=A0A9Q1JW26_9CARY|nr:hypothetical protein Cgig2_021905 [Carnegiea gigantea]